VGKLLGRPQQTIARWTNVSVSHVANANTRAGVTGTPPAHRITTKIPPSEATTSPAKKIPRPPDAAHAARLNPCPSPQYLNSKRPSETILRRFGACNPKGGQRKVPGRPSDL